LSATPATSQWCHIYRWYSVVTFTWTVHCGTHFQFGSPYLGTCRLPFHWPGPVAPPDVWRPRPGRTGGTRYLTRGKTLQQMLRTWRHTHWTWCSWVRDVYCCVHNAAFCSTINQRSVCLNLNLNVACKTMKSFSHVCCWQQLYCTQLLYSWCMLLAAAVLHTAVVQLMCAVGSSCIAHS
jgi:hypothetical protein